MDILIQLCKIEPKRIEIKENWDRFSP